jgi:hypothetical protein
MRLGKCVDSIRERQTVESVIFVNGRRGGAAEFKAGIRRKNAIEPSPLEAMAGRL